ncbi:MAG: lysophospholipid acyltransferase family protein [Patescibacteria group bacterium]
MENIPARGPILLVSNHVGLQDPQLLITTLMRCFKNRKIHVIAKWKIFHSQLIQNWLGTIPLYPDRSRSFESAKNLLNRGEIVLIYPEGGVNSSNQIGKIKTGAARLALMTKVPVIPISLIRTSPPPQKPADHRRDLVFGRVQIKIGKPLDLSPWYNLTIDNNLLKKVNQAIMAPIANFANKIYIG